MGRATDLFKFEYFSKHEMQHYVTIQYQICERMVKNVFARLPYFYTSE